MHFDLVELIRTVGYLGVFTIVFLESGLLIGFFFPGDSLLFTAGFLASQGYLDIKILITGCFIFAVLGDSIGYLIGKSWDLKYLPKIIRYSLIKIISYQPKSFMINTAARPLF